MELFSSAGVKLNSGTNYGSCGAGFVRMNIATQTAVLQKALACIEKARQAHFRA